VDAHITPQESLEICRADNDSNLLEQIQRLRFQVYCQERNFLDANHYPDGRETDKYDRNSLHFCAVDGSGNVAAAVRLVLHSEHGFPLMKYCSLYPHERDAIQAAPMRVAEVSRFVSSRQCRGSSGANAALSFYDQFFSAGRLLGVTQLVAAMERPLVRLLARDGLVSRQIGHESEYAGRVIPCSTLVSDFKRIGPKTSASASMKMVGV